MGQYYSTKKINAALRDGCRIGLDFKPEMCCVADKNCYSNVKQRLPECYHS